MRSKLVVILAAAASLFVVATTLAAPPPVATARCRDGTYSFSAHRSGTCSHHGGVDVWLTSSGAASTGALPAATTVRVSIGRTILLAARTKSRGCRRGAEPDRRCSPGAYYSGLTKAVICSAGFRTDTIRNVPAAEKHAVEVEYGMTPKAYGRTIEIDHIVSLELGGSNDIANLFPEPGSGPATYHVKDELENRLHEIVCAGRMTLRSAQHAIAADWIALFRRVFGAGPTG